MHDPLENLHLIYLGAKVTDYVQGKPASRVLVRDFFVPSIYGIMVQPADPNPRASIEREVGDAHPRSETLES